MHPAWCSACAIYIFLLTPIGESQALAPESRNKDSGCSERVSSQERTIALADGTLVKWIHDRCAEYPEQLVVHWKRDLCEATTPEGLSDLMDVLKRLAEIMPDDSRHWGAIAHFLSNRMDRFAFDHPIVANIGPAQYAVIVHRENKLRSCLIKIQQRRIT
jgi:hypothetical protein